MMKINSALAATTLAILAGCGGGTSTANNNPVQVGQNIQAGQLLLTVDEIYSNGSALASWTDSSSVGVSFRTEPADFINDTPSVRDLNNVVYPVQNSTRLEAIPVTKTASTIDRAGTRYVFTMPNSTGYASSQILTDNNGTNIELSAWGTPATTMPQGQISYGGDPDHLAFLHINGQTIEMPFLFVADLTNSSATFTASSGVHQIDGGIIALDPVTGSFYGNTARLGETAALVDGSIVGSLVGAGATGVTGIVYGTATSPVTVSANFVGGQ